MLFHLEVEWVLIAALRFFLDLEALALEVHIALAELVQVFLLIGVFQLFFGRSNVRVELFESLGAEHDAHIPDLLLLFQGERDLLLHLVELLLPRVLETVVVHLPVDHLDQARMLHHPQRLLDGLLEDQDALVFPRDHCQVVFDLRVVHRAHIDSLMMVGLINRF